MNLKDRMRSGSQNQESKDIPMISDLTSLEQAIQKIRNLQSDMNLIQKDYQEKILLLSSENSDLKKEIQSKSETIVSLNGKIETLYKSDLILKQNEKLQEEIQIIQNETTATISAVKQEYAEKEKLLFQRLYNATQMEQAAQKLESSYQNKLLAEATRLTEDARNIAAAEYDERSRQAEKLFKNRTYFFYGTTICSILYGFIVTLFSALKSERFSNDFVESLSAFWLLLSGPFRLAIRICNLVWKIKSLINIDVINTVIAILFVIAAFLLVAGSIYVASGCFLYRIGKFYRKEFWDSTSAAVTLISLAALVWFADQLNWLRINLILIWIIVHVIYLLIRMLLTQRKRN